MLLVEVPTNTLAWAALSVTAAHLLGTAEPPQLTAELAVNLASATVVPTVPSHQQSPPHLPRLLRRPPRPLVRSPLMDLAVAPLVSLALVRPSELAAANTAGAEAHKTTAARPATLLSVLAQAVLPPPSSPLLLQLLPPQPRRLPLMEPARVARASLAPELLSVTAAPATAGADLPLDTAELVARRASVPAPKPISSPHNTFTRLPSCMIVGSAGCWRQ